MSVRAAPSLRRIMSSRPAAVEAAMERPRWDRASSGRVAVAQFALSAIALLIAGIGIHGLLAYAVSQRTQELGIRRALGEEASSILGRVLREGLVLAASGVVVGVFVAWLWARGMSALLFGITPSDPVTFGIAAALCVTVAVLVCLRPAIRASRVDPMAALRGD